MSAEVDPEHVVVQTIRILLERRLDEVPPFEMGADLHDDLGLDSLELAELSATLEDDLGRDPYSAGVVPRTVGEVVAFYR
jgi:acyl carrier protein